MEPTPSVSRPEAIEVQLARPRGARLLRRAFEKVIVSVLVGCAGVSIFVTFSIVAVLFQQSVGFFGLHGQDTPGALNERDASNENAPLASVETLRINEVRLGMPGDAQTAYVEIHGPANASLDGMQLLLTGRPVTDEETEPPTGDADATVLAAVSLDDASLDGNGYFLIGNTPGVFGRRARRSDAHLAAGNTAARAVLLIEGSDAKRGDTLDADVPAADALALTPDPTRVPPGPVQTPATVSAKDSDSAPMHAFRSPVTGDWRTGSEDAVHVTLSEFLFGVKWNPLLGADKHFGIWPLVTGTLLVTGVAMLFAVPGGLLTAIFLSEYAPRRLRAMLKPVLEVLAGIPTVVYGFFALTVITPGLRAGSEWFSLQLFRVFSQKADTPDGAAWQPLEVLGLRLMERPGPMFEVYNAFSAGMAVGIMCLPIVTSLSEDALRAVPRSLREGAYGLGATKFDVATKVVVPAGLSGIIAAFLLAIARAVGETMIVALAAGNLARMTMDPTVETQTMTAYMVQIFLGDASNFGPAYLSSYAVAAALFVITLLLTLIGARVLKRFREEYE